MPATSPAQTAQREVLELLLLTARRMDPMTWQPISLMPSHFALARPGGMSLKTAVSEAAAGYGSDHEHAGFRAVFRFACGFKRADGQPCGSLVSVCVRDAEPNRLFVRFDGSEHRHAAGFCPHTGQPCAEACLSRGLHPQAQPTGVPPRLFAAALLVRSQSWMQGRDGGVITAASAVLRAALQLAPPAAGLNRNETWFGTDRSWEDVLRHERARRLLRLHVAQSSITFTSKQARAVLHGRDASP
jgi:hypothetical protein